MRISKEKSKFKAADFEMKIFRGDGDIVNLRTLDSNAIINQLEDDIELRETPIEKRLRKKIDVKE
jgi:hypothetical protein